MKNGGGDRVPSRAEQELCRHFLEEELKLINPKLIIPIGRLAIERFFGTDNSLEELIGTELHQDGRWIVPLPHPSGASRWHQVPENRKRIDKAIRSIARRYRQLFPTRGLSNSS
jgi:uracil-DNA glycosylase